MLGRRRRLCLCSWVIVPRALQAVPLAGAAQPVPAHGPVPGVRGAVPRPARRRGTSHDGGHGPGAAAGPAGTAQCPLHTPAGLCMAPALLCPCGQCLSPRRLLGGHWGLCPSTFSLLSHLHIPSLCWDSSVLSPATSLVLPQAPSNPPALESAHLLLAIFREVTALYGARDPSLHPKLQVGQSPLSPCDKPAPWGRMEGISSELQELLFLCPSQGGA